MWQSLINYDVYISEIVLEEIDAVSDTLKPVFLKAIKGFNILKLNSEIENLAKEYVRQGIFPEKYYDDALHVAFASVNGIGFLLSWNFKHLVKVKTRKLVALLNSINDYKPVEIIAPPEL